MFDPENTLSRKGINTAKNEKKGGIVFRNNIPIFYYCNNNISGSLIDFQHETSGLCGECSNCFYFS